MSCRGRAYLEVVHLPDDGLAQPGQGVRVLAGRHHVVVPDGGEALVAEQLLLDLGQAGLELLLLADVSVRSHQDDGRQRSHSLQQSECNPNVLFTDSRVVRHLNHFAFFFEYTTWLNGLVDVDHVDVDHSAIISLTFCALSYIYVFIFLVLLPVLYFYLKMTATKLEYYLLTNQFT